VVYRDREHFGAKSRNYDTTMKRVVKKHLLGMSAISRKKESAQKELK
jgi:hypothetical protein